SGEAWVYIMGATTSVQRDAKSSEDAATDERCTEVNESRDGELVDEKCTESGVVWKSAQTEGHKG
ncbi:hypothetical protein P4O66_009181, partial [Electrophorus voltai]